MLQKVKPGKKSSLPEKRRSITVRLGEDPWQKLEFIRFWRSRDEGKAWSGNAVVLDLIEREHKHLSALKRPKKAANG